LNRKRLNGEMMVPITTIPDMYPGDQLNFTLRF